MCKLNEGSHGVRLYQKQLESMFLDDLPLHVPHEYVENMGRQSWTLQFSRVNDNSVAVTWIHDERRVPDMKFAKFQELAKTLNQQTVYLNRCEHGLMTFAYTKIITLTSSQLCLCCFVKQMKDEWLNIVKQAA